MYCVTDFVVERYLGDHNEVIQLYAVTDYFVEMVERVRGAYVIDFGDLEDQFEGDELPLEEALEDEIIFKFFGLTLWGRTTFGQPAYQDAVIELIVADRLS